MTSRFDVQRSHDTFSPLTDDPAFQGQLTGRSKPFGTTGWLILSVCLLVGFWLRLHQLSAEGFGDDEVHKWLAANRYLAFDFVGDDIEHPMMMKVLIALVLLVGRPLGWAPETIVRLPNIFAATVTIGLVAMLGRRLYGRTTGLLAAALCALSTTLIGYQRVAKEDTLVGMFLLLALWAAAEAKAAADGDETKRQKTWEWVSAAAIGGMMASKYFPFLAPIPLLFYWWLPARTTKWQVSVKRWFLLVGSAFVLFVLLDWVELLPATWEYQKSYFHEQKTIHGALFFMGTIYHNLPSYGLHGTSLWFYPVFFAVKFAPVTVVAMIGGIVWTIWRHAPADKLLLTWTGVWAFSLALCSGSKWGRFTVSVMPGFLLFASVALMALLARLRLTRWPGLAAASVLLLAPEAYAAISHAPHYRLYVNAFGGGDANEDWFFPHCDYFDTGYREAVAYVAAHAEPNAELTTEVDWLGRYYLEVGHRPDMQTTMSRRDIGCVNHHVCYVVVQSGRWYFQNADAIEYLRQRQPWHVERIDDIDVVKVYRLEPDEPLYPPSTGRDPLADLYRPFDPHAH